MTEEHKIILAGAFSILGQTLSKSRLLDESWRPIPRKKLNPQPSLEDIELVELFKRLTDEVMVDGGRKAEERAKVIDEAIKALPGYGEGKLYVDYVLTSLYMIREVGDELKGRYMLFYSKANNLINGIVDEVREELGQMTAIQSWRVADNLMRYVKGQPILDDEIRNAWLKSKGIDIEKIIGAEDGKDGDLAR